MLAVVILARSAPCVCWQAFLAATQSKACSATLKQYFWYCFQSAGHPYTAEKKQSYFTIIWAIFHSSVYKYWIKLDFRNLKKWHGKLKGLFFQDIFSWYVYSFSLQAGQRCTRQSNQLKYSVSIYDFQTRVLRLGVFETAVTCLPIGILHTNALALWQFGVLLHCP